MSNPGTDAVATLWPLAHEDPVGRAVILPGGSGYTADHPLLWWAAQVLAENGWLVATVRWQIDEAARADAARFVARAAQDALDLLGPADTTLVVAKSFGTWAAPWAAGQGWPGVWLTPVLTAPDIAAAFVDSPTAGLLVGGSADDLWDDDLAARSGLDVLEIDDADHILYTAGEWQRSYDQLGRTLEAIERFAASLL